MTTATELLANLAGSIAQMGGGNVHDYQGLREASRTVLRECGIKPMPRIKAARELKMIADALAGLEMMSAYVEEATCDASAQAMLEMEAARTSLARKIEPLVQAVTQPLR